MRNIYQKIGKKKFYQKLLKIDPLSKNKFVYTDTQRVLRAYEVKKFTKNKNTNINGIIIKLASDT